MALPLSRDSRWIFIGDSITDCGRRECPEAVGSGYVRGVRDWLRASKPALAPQVLNKGISGNTISDLQRRWDSDVLACEPQLVSIKIGINDVWHGLGAGEGTSIERFREIYADILGRLRTACPKAMIVLCEPSVIWPPAPAEGNEMLKPYVAAVRETATDFGVREVVPLHGAFEKAGSARPDIEWAPDGVHPSSSGHMLIARSWLACLGLL
ncbi:MAG TPA: SGNH/GDSL hydrolase family protein [Terrimicrobiaceae bacterium]